MSLFKSYTTRARELYYKYPFMSHVSIQINFWVIAYMILALILHNYAHFVNDLLDDGIPYAPVPAFLGSFIFALLFGSTLGISDYLIFSKWNRERPIIILMLLKGLFYFLSMTLLFMLMRYVVFETFIFKYFFTGVGPRMLDSSWSYWYAMFAIYTVAMGLVISFINQMNRYFGPGVIIPLLFGKYINPKREKRIFMFLDLDNSTAHAEELGDIKYSEFLRDCFYVINQEVLAQKAEIYQYVGDEMVLTWVDNGDLKFELCIDFYYAVKDRLAEREGYFIKNFGVRPHFKAGAHFGWVTGVEVGSIRRDLAYHGDTINVAARVEEKCRDLDQELLITKELQQEIIWNGEYELRSYPDMLLKGKRKKQELFGIDRVIKNLA